MMPTRFDAKTLAFLCVMVLLAAPAAYATSIEIDPIMNIEVGGSGTSDTIGVGETVTVSLYDNEIPAGTDGNGLFGFGFAIVYDDSVLTSSAATAGALWVNVGFTDSRNTPGDVGMLVSRSFVSSGPSGNDILLASIDFTGVSPGVTSLTVGYYTGPGDNVLFDGTVLDNSLSFFQSGSIEVVPEPQTALLLGMGLIFLGARRHRRVRF